MRILFPTTITDAMIGAGTTIAEPDTTKGEIAWVSGGTYAVLNERIYSHRTFVCVQAHTGRTATPDQEPAFWLENKRKPSNRWAPFDSYTDTPATANGNITYVLNPGFFNGISLYGLNGDTITVTVKSGPGGAVIYTYTSDLFDQATGLYELLFSTLRIRDKLVLSDIPIHPTAQLTITVTGATASAIGMINVGDWRTVIGAGDWGGVQYGVSADPKTYSYIKFNTDGSSQIKRGGKATDMRGTVVMPAASADYANQLVQQVLDVPVSIVCTATPGFDYLNIFGLISGSIKADTSGSASFDYTVKGFL